MQRHALIFDEPGSEISLKSQSRVAVNGLSMGPNKTLVGKHSLKTAENHITYNMLVIHLITFIIMDRFSIYQYLYYLFQSTISSMHIKDKPRLSHKYQLGLDLDC